MCLAKQALLFEGASQQGAAPVYVGPENLVVKESLLPFLPVLLNASLILVMKIMELCRS